MEGGDAIDHRSHKTVKSGRGAKEKKKDRRAKKEHTRVERHNPRAFSVANIVRTQRTIQRNLDREQKKEYVPLKDRRAEEVEAPPSLVVVMGPSGVGKVNTKCSVSIQRVIFNCCQYSLSHLSIFSFISSVYVDSVVGEDVFES